MSTIASYRASRRKRLILGVELDRKSKHTVALTNSSRDPTSTWEWLAHYHVTTLSLFQGGSWAED